MLSVSSPLSAFELTKFHEIWYEHYATVDHPTSHFLISCNQWE